MKTLQFIAIVLTALALVPGGAHLFALPNKIHLSESSYFIAQNIYRGWALLGIVLIGAVLANAALAVLMRGQRPAFILALISTLCLIATLAIFFTFTYPANQVTNNWTQVPANWEELRWQWEVSHAVNAAITFAALCDALTRSSVLLGPRIPAQANAIKGRRAALDPRFRGGERKITSRLPPPAHSRAIGNPTSCGFAIYSRSALSRAWAERKRTLPTLDPRFRGGERKKVHDLTPPAHSRASGNPVLHLVLLMAISSQRSRQCGFFFSISASFQLLFHFFSRRSCVNANSRV